jgi:hypothetical protein
VRLALMAQAIEQLGTLPGEWLCGIDPAATAAGDPSAARHLTAVAPVVDFLLEGALPGTLGTMRELCDAKPDRWREREHQVGGWISQVSADAPAVVGDITTARHACAASVAAWHQLAQKDDEAERRAQIARLASTSTEILLRSGPVGTRGDLQPDADETARGLELCSALLKNAKRVREEIPEGPDGIQN